MPRFEVGDRVVVENFTDYWNGCEAEVYKIDDRYVYLTGTDKRFEVYKQVGAPYEAGFGPGHMRFVESEYQLACQILGEDYFA